MQYFVKGEFVEENVAGKTMQETRTFIENVIHPSLTALDKVANKDGGNGSTKKVFGGVAAGERIGYLIMEASNHEEVGAFLRSLPFWGALKWTIVPLQSFQSAIDQDKAAFSATQQRR